MTTVKSNALFEEHVKEYEKWFQEHPAILETEAEAIRALLPEGESRGIEIGSGSGHLALALGLKEGVEPSDTLRQLSIERGLEVIAGKAEELPFKDMTFDFVILSTSLHYIEDIERAFREAYRVIKPAGCFILGFIDPKSSIGKEYLLRRKQSTFYRMAKFYNLETLERKLYESGFKQLRHFQTLFGTTAEITQVQLPRPGIGSGSFILIKAMKLI